MKSNKKKNHMVFMFLISQGCELCDTVSFILKALCDSSQSDIAQKLNVSRPFVNQVILGQRKTARIRNEITKALGFDPWAV